MLDSNKAIYKILDYASALDVVKGMEAKDFRNRGIVHLFSFVASWADKYVTNKILPNLETISNEISMEKDKVESLLQDLCFRSLVPIIKKVTVIDFDPIRSEKSEFLHKILKRNTVFLRPPTMDGDSAMRIINFCNEGSVNNIKRGIAGNRLRFSGEKFKEFIFSKITENKLNETYANWDISQLFNCKYDTTKNMKEETFNLHLKPVLKMLSDDKIILFFRNEKSTKTANKSIFLYNDPEEVIERKNYYAEYLLEIIVPKFIKMGIIGEPKESELDNTKLLAENVLKFMDQTFGDEKTVVEEILILENHLDMYKKEMAQKELAEKLLEIIKYLETSGKISKLKNLRLNEEPLSKELITAIVNNDKLYHVEHEESGSYHVYLLHKSCVKDAIYLAKRLYEETKNDIEIRILSRMHIHDDLDEIQKKNFIEVETLSLFKYLNIFARIWRSLFGSKIVSEVESVLLKNKIEHEQKRKVDLLKAKEIDEETARRVEEKLKGDKKAGVASQELKENKDKDRTKKEKKSSKELESEKQQLKKISSIIDSAWDRGIYPDREYLHRSYDEIISEEELVEQIKKNFSNELFSFQIKSAVNPPKYKWPILITKSYLKQKGKELLQKAKSEHDREKKASVPNQEKFDLYSSMEEFLERILKKI